MINNVYSSTQLTTKNSKDLKSNLDSTQNTLQPINAVPEEDTLLNSVNFSYLRDKLELVQKLKRDAEIDAFAAMPIEPFSVIALISGAVASARTAYDIYKSWSNEKSQKDAVVEIDKAVTNAIESLGEKNWNNDLLSTSEEESKKGIELIKSDNTLKNTNKITRSIEIALDKLLKSKYHSTDADNKLRNIQTTRGLILALEALYQRSDMTSSLSNPCNNFVKYLEDPSNYPLIKKEDASLESLRRILVINWKVPLSFKIPSHQLQDSQYRQSIYNTMLNTIYDPKTKILTGNDPLYLRSKPPSDIETKVKELRETLVKTYKYESDLSDGPHNAKYSKQVVDLIGNILEHSTEIPKLSWSETARNELQKEQDNEKRLVPFKRWVVNLQDIFQMTEEQVEACFKSFDNPLIKFMGYLPERGDNPAKHLELFLRMEQYINKAHLNDLLDKLLETLDLETTDRSKMLNEKNTEKGLFFLRYLNALMEKKVIVSEISSSPSPYKAHLNEKNTATILRACKKIVHDEESFPSTMRGYDFFNITHTTSVPGQALALHRKLTWHINDATGYVDLYGLKKLILANAIKSIYPNATEVISRVRSFVLSGPPGTGKSSFGVALSNHLAVPLFILEPNMITEKKHNYFVMFEGKQISLHEFFIKVNESAPCVLLIDEADQTLSPREKQESKSSDNDENNKLVLTGKLLSEIEKKGEEGLSEKVILLMTTNKPLTESFDVSSIDQNGYSGMAEEELCKYIDSAIIREGRADKKIFTFHKLYTEQQGEALARRFISPYIATGKIIGDVDYAEAARVLMNYSPATSEKVFQITANAMSGPISYTQMLDELKKRPGLLMYHLDPEIKRSIETTISILVDHLKLKKLNESLDFRKLALSAKETGLNISQLTSAISTGTPEILTMQALLDAFEKAKEKKDQ